MFNKYGFMIEVLRGKGLMGNPILFGGGNFRTRFVGHGLVVALVISERSQKSGESLLLVLL